MTLNTKSLGGKIALYLLSIACITLWGMSYLWSDQLLKLGIPVEYFLFVRIFIAAIILLIINLFLGYKIKMEREDSLMFIVLAACEPMIYFFCETYGIKYTESPTYAALIIASTPIFAAMAGFFFFKEHITWVNRLGITVCLVGLVLTSITGGSVGKYFILGVVLLLIAVFAEVGQTAATKALTERYKPSVIVMYQFFIGSILMFPTFLSTGIVNFDPEVYLSWPVFRPILYLAALCSATAFTLWALTIKHLGVAKSCIFLAMIPVVTALVGWLLGQEALRILQWVGIAVACVGVIFSQWGSKKEPEKEAE